MQLNQWKAASRQLIGHWHRSGVRYLPIASQATIARAIEWVQQNTEIVANDDSPTRNSGPSEADSSPPVSMAPTIAPTGPTTSPNAGSVTNLAHSDTTRPVASEPKFVSPPPSPRTAPLSLEQSSGVWTTSKADFVAQQQALESLNKQVVECRKCQDIVCRRSRTVFGVGPVNARIVMFGEAPGAEEDRVGEPFVGAAGQLMDKILTASSLKREEVYIMNSLKCRPPNNRTPTDLEIENCRPFFEEQLEAIQPEYIVCWGSIAVRAVLKTTESVGRLRGKFHAFRGAKVMVTYHPAYLLRNPDAKKLTWEDMKMLMREIGIPVPGAK
jgi:uracil-DNA glycosylase